MIYKEQLKRLGYVRMLLGGFSMYLSIPFLIVFHLINVKLFLDLIAGYTLNLPRLDISRFLVIDRYKYDELSIMDKLNCVFCGYANGLATYFEARNSQIYLYSGELIGKKKYLFIVGLFFYRASKILYLIHGYLLYKCLIFKVLSYVRTSLEDAPILIKEKGLPETAKCKHIQSLMPNEIIFSVLWLENLEQIESAWCPVKHIKQDAIYPRHHTNFYSIQDLEKAIALIKKYGTVSKK